MDDKSKCRGEPVKVPSVPDAVFLGCARMGMAEASDEEVLNYVRIATRSAPTPPVDERPTPEEEEAWQQMEKPWKKP